MIKRRLATLAPKMKVFLDVDDLEEFGTLADNVAASDVVLLFLSRGYFASKACKIEYMAACRLGTSRPCSCTSCRGPSGTFSEASCVGKPVVVVHESNENHGGAPSSPERSPEITRDHPRFP